MGRSFEDLRPKQTFRKGCKFGYSSDDAMSRKEDPKMKLVGGAYFIETVNDPLAKAAAAFP